MSPKDKLVNLLREYIDSFGEQTDRLKSSSSKVRYVPMGNQVLISEVAKLMESQPVFDELVKATRAVYGDECTSIRPSMGIWPSMVKHFFQRSGIYVDCFEKSRIENFERVLALYDQAFTTRNIPVTYLAPLEGVTFTALEMSRERLLDFGTFQIRLFSPEELSELVANRINNIFYPYASWDIEKLSWYWFLMIQCSEDVEPGKIVIDFSDLGSIRRKPIPKEISPLCPTLYRLVLFDWRPEQLQEKNLISPPWSGFRWCDLGIQYSVKRLETYSDKFDWERWYGFGIPIVGKVAPNLIDSPPPAPDATRLELIPASDYKGEEIERPVEWFNLNEEETLSFEKFLREETDLIDNSLLETWPFFQRALEYLTKAFLTNPFDSAPEQLLWHITSIEALLGKSEDEKVVEPLARRLSRIIGSNASQRNRIKYQFRELYSVRSDLVHGNPWEEYSSAYLYEARNFAQRACLWFINLARDYREKHIPLPNRDQILSDIDSG